MKIDQSWPEDGRQKGQVILGQLLRPQSTFTSRSTTVRWTMPHLDLMLAMGACSSSAPGVCGWRYGYPLPLAH
ncbi:MAG: hypothetical protein GY941_07665 [Planctomycetes bacterium]|nr:hypothetical protein [Planctomycetota bacterium]